MKFTKRIHYHDTDLSGAVYHANYLKFFEEARYDFLAEKGFPVEKLVAGGTGFAVRHQEMEYKAPAFYGDELTIEIAIKEITPYRIVFSYIIKNQSQRLIGKAATELVCVNKSLELTEIPADLADALKQSAG